jgi:hypothetical protein
MRRIVVVPLGVVCALACTPPSAIAALPLGPGELRIATPADGGLVRAKALTLVVRPGPGARLPAVKVDGRRVRAKFRRAGSKRARVWRARVSTVRLRPGVHRLQVVGRDRARRPRHDERTFVVGRRAPRLLRLKAPSRAAVSPARVRVRVPVGAQVRATLNGRAASNAFGSELARTRRGRMGANDGLRFGVNRLRVVAWDPDSGRYAVRRTRFRLARRAPLVGAGPDTRVPRRRSVRLSARSSRPARGGRLSYRWRIAQKPAGARPRLVRPRTATPRLRTDRRGVYRVAVTVTEHGRGSSAAAATSSSTDVATVSAQQPVSAMGLPISTAPAGGGDGIVLGGQTQAPTGSGIQVLVIDRDSDSEAGGPGATATQPYQVTVDVQQNLSFDGDTADLEELEATLEGLEGSSPLVILTAPAGTISDPAAFSSAVAQMGSGHTYSSSDVTDAVSVIGVPGTTAGTAWENPGNDLGAPGLPAGNMTGFLGMDSKSNFAFVYGEYVPFDTGGPGTIAQPHTITVGGTPYTVTGGPNQSGYHVVAWSPDAASQQNVFLPTNASLDNSTPTQDLAFQQQAAEFLAKYVGNGDVTLLIESIGLPTPTTLQWNGVADGISALGGNIHVFNTSFLNGPANAIGSYALVTGGGDTFQERAINATEASPTVNQQPGTATGVLRLSRETELGPAYGDPTGQIAGQAMTLAYQGPSTWEPIDPASNQFIACLLGFSVDDVRINYVQDIGWGPLQTTLTGLTDEPTAVCPGTGVTGPNFDAAQTQLKQEVAWLNQVTNLLLTDYTLNVYGTATSAVNLQQLATDAVTSTDPPQQTGILTEVGQLISDAFYLVPDDTTSVLGAMFGAASDLGSDSEGNSAGGTLSTTPAAMEGDLNTVTSNQVSALANLKDIFVSDADKLSTAGAAILAQADSGGPWTWNTPVQDATNTKLGASISQWLYRQYLPLTFTAWQVGDAQVPPSDPAAFNVNTFICHGTKDNLIPFQGEPQPTVTLPQGGQFNFLVNWTFPSSTESAPEWVRWAMTSGSNPTSFGFPTTALLSDLFRSPSNGGAGAYPPWFASQTFVSKPFSCPSS